MVIRIHPDFERPVFDILGLPFDAVSRNDAVQKILNAITQHEPLFVSTPNLNFLIASQSDKAFRDSIYSSDLCVADGMPIVWLARLMGVPIVQRVAGSDLFEALRDQSQRTVKVFFFGGPDGAAQAAAEQINALAAQRSQRQELAGVVCVGCESPGFGTLDEMSQPEVIARINATQPDFVVVALGARKGQAWIERNRGQLEAPVISHLGAVVNMAAGTIARAPKWIQSVGLEWVWRIKEEPLLWRRYASDGLALLRLMVFQVLPSVIRRQWQKFQTARPAHLAIERIGEITRLRLTGTWSTPDLDILRAQIAMHYGDAKFEIDVRQADYLDASVRGLLSIIPACRVIWR